MAKRMHRNKKTRGSGRLALAVFAALLTAVLTLTGIAALNANTVCLRRARVRVGDLPAAFEGKTVLFASDIDLCGLNTPRKAAALFNRLQQLDPDILLLGGDYTSKSLLEILNSGEDRTATDRMRRAQTDFFRLIADFHAPLGKFAIAAPEDPDPDALRRIMAETGLRPLFDDSARIDADGDALWIAGISSAGLRNVGAAYQRSDCVIAAAWSPTAFPMMVTSEARDGGPWADLLLSGHTHGGQFHLFGRTALALDDQERRYSPGWRLENGVPVLVSSGVGCEGVNLRLGSRAEVWLITLTAGG